MEKIKMTADRLRQLYLDFFKSKGHAVIPSASLIPENDPTVLFTTAGMHPLVPYLMGEKHPAGNRLVNVQKCIRTSDIDEVGDSWHLTFFEMLGNWSLGDYWKKEAIEWSFEFLTDKKYLGIAPEKLSVTVFKGDNDAPADEEAAEIWQRLGIAKERIFYLSKEDNWWGPAGQTGPCGPCTEMFFDTDKEKCGPDCKPGCQCGKYAEIWNDVFMQYNKTAEGKFLPLEQKNVDTGMGVERTVAVLGGFNNVYDTELFTPIIKKIEEVSSKKYEGDNIKAFRIIADHIKAATFILGDEKGITPSNVGQGYVLRRLIRQAVNYGKQLGINNIFTFKIAEEVIRIYQDTYIELRKNKNFITNQLVNEEEKFKKALQQGHPEVSKAMDDLKKELSLLRQKTDINIGEYKIIDDREKIYKDFGKRLFNIYQKRGIRLEMALKECENQGFFLPFFKEEVTKSFNEEMKKHQELSRTASAGMFKGGLADASEQTIKYHTAAHLMLAALREVLGKNVVQKGSNITAERLRFDFSFDRKMTPDEINWVEKIVNEKIKEDLPVICEEMSLKEAKAKGAMGIFESKYGEKVKVYSIADFSKEICGGPHVERTGVLGKFKIIKEEASSFGVRRIKAVLK